ncbi:MAG TPA: response regulator [Candidatus Sulfotelmatobacter sp.]
MSLKLLVAEDDALSRDLMNEVFTSLNAAVLRAEDGQKAAAMVNQQKFDGIFLDLDLPRIDGLDLVRKTRASSWNKSTPIVAVTGRDDRDSMQRAFASGVNFFLQKPADRQRLSSLFRAVRGSLVANHRRNMRVPLRTDVTCSIDSRNARGTSWNLSEGGMQLDVPGLQPRNSLQVSFRLPISGERIDAHGVVVWATESREGIQFTKVSSQSAAAIRKYIAEVEKPDWISK